MSRWRVVIKRPILSILFFAFLASALQGAERQRYGGTLRVELRATAVSLDPREWKAGTMDSATNEKMGAMVFDRLVSLDNYGRFQPQLATEWSHDASFKRWQFILRAGVKFSDGSVLTGADVGAALQPLLPEGQQISAAGNTVTIQSAAAMPDLLEEVASGRYFVYRAQPDGMLLGTGPFILAETAGAGGALSSSSLAPSGSNSARTLPFATKATQLRFRASEETWSGRPFVDAIEVSLGVPPLRQVLDLQLGKADVVELSPELVRKAMQDNQRVWSSAPVTFYGLRFEDTPVAAADAKLREAMSLSLDRQTMANVLLQKQAEPASALLPQWLSGYAFLFTMETDLDRAKEIRTALAANTVATADPLRLHVDAPGDLAKLLGERVAVNARQASILVQVVNRPVARFASSSASVSSDPADGVHLFSWHYSSLSPRVELETMVALLKLAGSNDATVSSTDPEQLYAREKKLLEERKILPLVVLPEYIGLSQKVRDWMPARWGEWRLADLWLDRAESGTSPAESSGNPASVIPASASPGAKP